MEKLLLVLIQLPLCLLIAVALLLLILVSLPALAKLSRTGNIIFHIKIIQKMRIVHIADLHRILQADDPADPVFHLLQFPLCIHMLYINKSDGNRSDACRQKIPYFGVKL